MKASAAGAAALGLSVVWALTQDPGSMEVARMGMGATPFILSQAAGAYWLMRNGGAANGKPDPERARRAFFRFWNRVQERVVSKEEGKLTVSDGWNSQLRVYSIARQEGPLQRIVLVRELEVGSRHPEIPPYFERTVVFERRTPTSVLSASISEDGKFQGGDPELFRQEYLWWHENLEPKHSLGENIRRAVHRTLWTLGAPVFGMPSREEQARLLRGRRGGPVQKPLEAQETALREGAEPSWWAERETLKDILREIYGSVEWGRANAAGAADGAADGVRRALLDAWRKAVSGADIGVQSAGNMLFGQLAGSVPRLRKAAGEGADARQRFESMYQEHARAAWAALDASRDEADLAARWRALFGVPSGL